MRARVPAALSSPATIRPPPPRARSRACRFVRPRAPRDRCARGGARARSVPPCRRSAPSLGSPAPLGEYGTQLGLGQRSSKLVDQLSPSLGLSLPPQGLSHHARDARLELLGLRPRPLRILATQGDAYLVHFGHGTTMVRPCFEAGKVHGAPCTVSLGRRSISEPARYDLAQALIRDDVSRGAPGALGNLLAGPQTIRDFQSFQPLA